MSKTKEITIATYTANSWFGWGDPIPDADTLALDLLSTAIYQSTIRGMKLEEVNRGFSSGNFAPGKTAATWGTGEIENLLKERNINASSMKLGNNPHMGHNPSPVAITAELLAALEPVIPENARPIVRNISTYALAADPKGKSSPEGMPLVLFSNLNAPGLKELITMSPKDGAAYLAISGEYHKSGFTVMGNGSGEITCKLKAVIYDSSAQPIWRTEVDGTGGSFTSALYFAPVWSSVESSAIKATGSALTKLARQIEEDFPKRAR